MKFNTNTIISELELKTKSELQAANMLAKEIGRLVNNDWKNIPEVQKLHILWEIWTDVLNLFDNGKNSNTNHGKSKLIALIKEFGNTIEEN